MPRRFMSQEYVCLTMVRESLGELPAYALPAPFSFRWYRPGDERLWREIQACADEYNDIAPELFESQFGGDVASLAERQCFLLDADGRAAGTATAWFDRDYDGLEAGRVHWVAIVPRMQGRGLAKPLLAAVCRRLRDLGHRRAYLTTAPERIPAIGLYLKFGFTPVVRGEPEAAAWEGVRERLSGRS